MKENESRPWVAGGGNGLYSAGCARSDYIIPQTPQKSRGFVLKAYKRGRRWDYASEVVRLGDDVGVPAERQMGVSA